LSQCRHIAVIRYGGSLFFANASYLENNVFETVRSMPELRHVVIVGNGMNEIDASGVDTLETVLERLHGQGLRVSLTGLNDRVVETLRRSGLLAMIGEENLYPSASRSIDAIWEAAHEGSYEKDCPLKMVPTIRLPVDEDTQRHIEQEWLPPGDPFQGEPPPTSGRVRAGEGQTVTLAIRELNCPACAAKVEEILGGVAGVLRVNTNFESRRAIVTVDSRARPDAAALIEALGKARYTAVVEQK
jgi:anti-anti-sigma factor